MLFSHLNLCSLHISSNKNISKIQIMQAMILSTHLVKLRHAFLPSARYRCLVSSIFPRRPTETVNPIPVLEQRDISRLPSIRTFHTNFFLQQYDRTLYENSVLDGPTKYYIDLKEGNDGKYVKISEKSRGKRSTIMVNLEILSSFTSKLMIRRCLWETVNVHTGSPGLRGHISRTRCLKSAWPTRDA